MPGRRAGSGVGKYNTESPKQGSKRFNYITNTIHFAYLGVLFIYDRTPATLESQSFAGPKSLERCTVAMVPSYILKKCASSDSKISTLIFFFNFDPCLLRTVCHPYGLTERR